MLLCQVYMLHFLWKKNINMVHHWWDYRIIQKSKQPSNKGYILSRTDGWLKIMIKSSNHNLSKCIKIPSYLHFLFCILLFFSLFHSYIQSILEFLDQDMRLIVRINRSCIEQITVYIDRLSMFLHNRLRSIHNYLIKFFGGIRELNGTYS